MYVCQCVFWMCIHVHIRIRLCNRINPNLANIFVNIINSIQVLISESLYKLLNFSINMILTHTPSPHLNSYIYPPYSVISTPFTCLVSLYVFLVMLRV